MQNGSLNQMASLWYVIIAILRKNKVHFASLFSKFVTKVPEQVIGIPDRTPLVANLFQLYYKEMCI